MRYYFVGLLALLLISGCTFSNQSKDQTTSKEVSTQIEKAKESKAANANIIYTNKKYNFELQLPKDWLGYATQERVLDWGTLGKADSIDFGFKKGQELESLFNISIYSGAMWKELQATEGPKPTYLGEDEGIVLGWDISQDTSDDTMMARRAEVQKIAESFLWTNKK